MKHRHKSLVLPHIDYCSQLWMPVDAANIQSLEKLQSDFFKRIPDLRGMNNWESLKEIVWHCVHACKGGKGEKAKSQSQGEIDWKQYCDEVATPLVLADVGM